MLKIFSVCLQTNGENHFITGCHRRLCPPSNTFDSVVVADNSWAAIQGRKALEISWEEGPNAEDNTEKSTARLKEVLQKPGTVYCQQGDVDANMMSLQLLEATFHSPYLARSPMEPPVCVAKVDGDACELWSPTQHPQWVQGEVARALGLDPSKVKVNVNLPGGGFGRKSKADFSVEAALAAKAAGQPLKVIWTREDEVRFGFYRSENMQYLKAALDEKGMPKAWLHRVAFPTIFPTFQPGTRLPGGFEMEMSCTSLLFQIPNLRMEACEAWSPLRIGWLRSVHHTFHSWAINCFSDELAQMAGRDPLSYHLELLGPARIIQITEEQQKDPFKQDTGRLARVIEMVREKSGWDKQWPKVWLVVL